METKEKLFHFHLSDAMENKSTLICWLKDGCISYTFYGGTGSSGRSFSLSNIQYYDLVNGNMKWVRSRELPVEPLEDETKEQFKNRVKKMLKYSTEKVIHEVQPKVKFKKED